MPLEYVHSFSLPNTVLSFPRASTILFRGAQPPTWGHRLPQADLPTRARRSSTCRRSCCLHYIDIAAWGCAAMWYIEGHGVRDDALLELSILDNIPIQSMACHCFHTGCGNLHVGSCDFCGQSNGECKMELVGKTVRSTCKYMPRDCITTQPSRITETCLDVVQSPVVRPRLSRSTSRRTLTRATRRPTWPTMTWVVKA